MKAIENVMEKAKITNYYSMQVSLRTFTEIMKSNISSIIVVVLDFGSECRLDCSGMDGIEALV